MSKYKIGNKDLLAAYIGSKRILSIWLGAEKLWPEDIPPIIEEILSCFAMGYWIDD
jgi:hypothetical protein